MAAASPAGVATLAATGALDDKALGVARELSESLAGDVAKRARAPLETAKPQAGARRAPRRGRRRA